MPKTFSGKKVVKILCREFGFFVVSQKGSHIKLTRTENGNKITTVVPNHKELATGTLRGALDLAQISYEKFLKIANKK